MNKEQYMKILKKRLRRLPKEDYNRAVEYFEEYFAEAGQGNEQQAIADLGDPKEAAEQIIRDIAIKNTKVPVKNVKSGLNAVWVGILAVCAAPVALPVLLMAVLVLLMLVFVVFMVVIVLFALGVSLVFAGPISIAGGISILTQSFANSMICIGWGLMGIGLGLLLGYGMYLGCRKFLNCMVGIFGHMVKGRGKKNE